MEISKNSDFILVLDLEDIKGEKMRVADVAEFELYVYTTDPKNALYYPKCEIVQDADCDRVPIDAVQLDQLKSGVVRYTYSYATWNEDFSETDNKYDKVKVVTTDVYFRNALSSPAKPANVVTYPMFLHLRDLINDEALAREQGDNQIRHYVEVEYTNRLDAEIERSTGVDESHAERLDTLETVLDTEKLRAETIEKALDRRMDEIENSVEILMGDDDVVGSVAHAVEDARHYTDDKINEVKAGYVKVSELEAVEAKIPVVNHNLSAYHNDCGYISNTDIFGNYYSKEDVNGLIADMDPSSIARKEEVTVIKDASGNVIHEMTITAEPEYYTKEETDEILKNYVDFKAFNYGTSLDEYDDDEAIVFTKDSEDFSVCNDGVYNINFPHYGVRPAYEFSNKRVYTLGIYGKILADFKYRDDLRYIAQCKFNGETDANGNLLYDILSVHPYGEEVEINPESDFITCTFSKTKELSYKIWPRKKVTDKIEGIDFSSFETIEGAAEKYQPVGDYLTEHQSLDDYYTKSEVDDKIEDVSALIDDKIGDIDFSSFETITGAAEKYQPVGDYLTEHQSLANYYTKTQINDTVNKLKQPYNGQVVFKYCTKETFGAYSTNGTLNGTYIKTGSNTYELDDSDVLMRSIIVDITQESSMTIETGMTGVSVFVLSNNQYDNRFADWTFGDVLVNPNVNTSGEISVHPGDRVMICRKINSVLTYTIGEKSQLELLIHELWADHAVVESLPDNYYNKEEIDEKIDDVSSLIDEKVDSIDLSPYETVTGAAEKYQPVGDYLTEHQSLDDYYTKSQVDGRTQAAVTAGVEQVRVQMESRISALEDIDHDQYLTQHQSLANYYTKSQVDTKIDDISTLIDDKIGDIDFSSYETVEGAEEKYQPKGDYILASGLVDKQMIWFGSEEDAPALEDRNSQTLYIIV